MNSVLWPRSAPPTRSATALNASQMPFAFRNLDCGPPDRRTVPRSNFHGRFFCRRVRFLRQKSRPLQFSRSSCSATPALFQTTISALDVASRDVACRYHGRSRAYDHDVRLGARVLGKLHRVHSVDSSPWSQSRITCSVALAGFAKFRREHDSLPPWNFPYRASPRLPRSSHSLFVYAIANDQGSCAFDRMRFRWSVLFAPRLFTR